MADGEIIRFKDSKGAKDSKPSLISAFNVLDEYYLMLSAIVVQSKFE